MGLKAKVEKLDDVDAKYHDLYEEKDGAFHLIPIEGLKPQAEFDTVHRALGQERDAHRTTKSALQKQQGDLDAAKAQVNDLQAVIDAGIKDDAAVQKLVEARVSQQVAPLQRKLTEAETKIQEQTGIITGFQTKEVTRAIGSQIRKAAAKSDVRDTAISDAIMFGESIFELQDGVAITKADITGVTPGVTPEVWLAGLRDQKPHWFKESAGGGGGAGGRGKGAGTNPWTKANWNLTVQTQMIREDRTKAEQMAKAAKSYIGALNPSE